MLDILSALIISYSVQIGYGHSEYVLWEDYKFSADNLNMITTKFDTELSLHGFYVGGGVTTPAKCNDNPVRPGAYSPIQAGYDVAGGYRYKSVEVGYKYRCEHPITTYRYSMEGIQRKYEGAYWQVFVKVENSFDVFK